jgi:hypothetical protein
LPESRQLERLHAHSGRIGEFGIELAGTVLRVDGDATPDNESVAGNYGVLHPNRLCPERYRLDCRNTIAQAEIEVSCLRGVGSRDFAFDPDIAEESIAFREDTEILRDLAD